MRSRGRVLEVAALLLVAGLPLLADAVREPVDRCGQDGAVVEDGYRVLVDLGARGRRAFCGVVCADRWLSRSGVAARAVRVTDAQTGALLDARDATFVETTAGWREGVPDPVRAFASFEAARAHVHAYGGEILAGPRRPLQYVAFGRWESAAHAR